MSKSGPDQTKKLKKNTNKWRMNCHLNLSKLGPCVVFESSLEILKSPKLVLDVSNVIILILIFCLDYIVFVLFKV